MMLMVGALSLTAILQLTIQAKPEFRELGRGQRIELRRFGVFNVKPRKTGIGRNPRTGQQVSIPPGKAVRFKPGKELQAL